MTGQLMGKTLITSLIVDSTIKKLVECEGLKPSLIKKNTADAAEERSVYIDDLATLAQSILFEDCSNVDRSHFYQLTRMAAEKDDSLGKVYQGICLIRGIGVERDWNGGFELLIDVASQEESCDAKDLALYTLGMCYEQGVYGFKKNKVKGRKWLNRVGSVPSYVTDYWNDSIEEDSVDTFVHARSAASIATSLTLPTALTESWCTECQNNDSIRLQCLSCKEKEINRLLFDT